MKQITLILFTLLISVKLTLASVIYVKESANGLNNGTSWTNAFTKLQDALAISLPNDEIWVAAGTYKPIYVTNASVNDRLVSFSIPNGVKLYGGFAGNETQLSQRDWNINESILSGNIASLTSAADNSHHVLTVINASTGTRVDGLKVISGYATGSVNYSYGGGLYTSNSNFTIANCEFTSNYARSGGAAIYNNASSGGVVNVINCKINGNSSIDGSIVSASGIFKMTHCDISENQGNSIISTGLNTTLDRCIVSGNVSDNYTLSELNAYNCLFVGNLAGRASVMDVYYSTTAPVFEFWNCTVVHNRSTSTNPDYSYALGGGRMGSVRYRNCIVWENSGVQQFYYTQSEDVGYCLVQGGYVGTGNKSTNPLFVNPGSAAIAPFNAQQYNYMLQSNSPALNSGSNTFTSALYNLDLLDSARISANTVDMGCYEKQYCSTTASITASGATNFCNGAFVNLTVPQSGAYLWSNGATSQTIAISSSGNYSVELIDANGCYGTASQQVTVYPASVQITGNTVLCNGSNTTLSVSSSDGNIFSWSTGNSGTSINVTQTGSYTVTVTTINSCTAIASVSVTQNNVNIPFISQSGSTLTSTPATAYQWYLNGNPINNATSQSYNPIQNGNYYVVVTENGCQSANSNTITVTSVGIDNISDTVIQIYPNPTVSDVVISSDAIHHIMIYDLSGQKVYENKMEQVVQCTVSLAEFPSGFYTIVVNGSKMKKLFKL